MDSEMVRDRFQGRIALFLGRLRDALVDAGCTVNSEPADYSYDEYMWMFAVRNTSGIDVDLTLTLIEQAVREGEGDGLAFVLEIVEWGGRILGTVCPHNYTPDLWGNDIETLEKRWPMFQHLEPWEVIEIVEGA